MSCVDLLDDDALIDLRRRARPTDPAAVLQEEGQRTAMPSANSALHEFQTPLATSPTSPPSPGAHLVAQGLCQLCGTRPHRGTCAMCGRAACAADLWVMLRLCRDCASDDAVARGQRGATPEDRNWLEGAR